MLGRVTTAKLGRSHPPELAVSWRDASTVGRRFPLPAQSLFRSGRYLIKDVFEQLALLD